MFEGIIQTATLVAILLPLMLVPALVAAYGTTLVDWLAPYIPTVNDKGEYLE